MLVCQVEKGSIVLVGFCQFDTNLGLSRKRQSQFRKCLYQIFSKSLEYFFKINDLVRVHCGLYPPRARSPELSEEAF